MEQLQADNTRQLRAAVLQIIYGNQQNQRSRLRFTPLYGAIARLGFDVSTNELITVLQDLQERGYVKYTRDEAQYRDYRKTVISEIQILPAGRDLVEKTNADAAVCFD